MNKDTAKDYLPLVQALAEGKTIQVKIHDLQGNFLRWEDEDNLNFKVPPYHYRIKPEPKKQSYRVALCINCKGHYISSLVSDKELDEPFSKMIGFVRWLTDRIEYTLPEGDA